MDQKLLDALTNLSYSLEAIAEAMADRNTAESDTAKALKSGNFVNTIEEINVGIKEIKKDTELILKQQKTILELSKKKQADSKTGAVDEAADPKKTSALKKGVSTILLIAVGVLAIGMAFKLIGKVDFLSVISLGIGMYMVSIAFEKIAKLNIDLKRGVLAVGFMVLAATGVWLASKFLSKVSPLSIGQIIATVAIAGLFHFVMPVMADMMNAMMVPTKVKLPNGTVITTKRMDMGKLIASVIFLPLLMAGMSLGIFISSKILAGVRPLGVGQIITSLLIAGMFAIAGKSMVAMIDALSKSKMGFAKLVGMVVLLPIVMLAISVGIWLSSIILGMVRPIGLKQAVTSILIAAVFAVISFGIGKIITAIGGLPPQKAVIAAIMIPLILPALALSIMISSYFLSKVVPIGLAQFVTSIAIAAIFVVFGIALKFIASAVGRIKAQHIVIIPLLFVALSVAVWLSSKILAKVEPIPYMKMLQILVFTIVLAVTVIIMAAAIWVVNKLGSVKDFIKGGISVLAIAGTILAASYILSKTKTMPIVKLFQLLLFSIFGGLSIVVFGLIIKLFDMIGVSIATAIKGGIVILAVAATVMAASHILSMGKYTKYPSLKWALGVAAALAAFGVGAVLLGTQALNPFFYAGLGIVLLVVGTIVAASHILSMGKYTKYPTFSWATGVGLALGAFGAGAVLLGFNVLNPFFYAGLKIITKIAQTIVDVSYILARGKYKNSITKEWASSVGTALGAFSEVYDMLADSKSLFGGPSPSEFAKAIMVVSKGITTAAEYFNKHQGAFKNGPPLEWAKGVGTAIGAFAPVFKVMEDFPFSAGQKIARSMVHVAEAIIRVAGKFSKSRALFSEGSYPSTKWGQGVGASLKAFAPVFDFMKSASWYESSYDKIQQMKTGILTIADAIVSVAKKFSKSDVNWKTFPDKNWAWNVGKNIKRFIHLTKIAENVDWWALDNVNNVVTQMAKTAKIMYNGSRYMNTRINPNFIKDLSKNVLFYAALTKELEKQRSFKGFLKDKLMGDPISNVASGMVKLAKAYDALSKSLRNFGTSLRGLDERKINQFRGLTANIAMLSALDSRMFDNMLEVLESRSSVFAKLLSQQAPSASRKTVGVGESVKKKKEEEKEKKGTYGNQQKQLDTMIELLAVLITKLGEGSSLDNYIQKKLSEKPAKTKEDPPNT